MSRLQGMQKAVVLTSLASLSLGYLLKRKAHQLFYDLICQCRHWMLTDGPLIHVSDVRVCASVLNAAAKRAARWALHEINTDKTQEHCIPLQTQVGGKSSTRDDKKVFLVYKPDFCLKPLSCDDRGFREVAFYESIRLANHSEASLLRRLQMEYGDAVHLLPEFSKLSFANNYALGRRRRYRTTVLKDGADKLSLFEHLWNELAMIYAMSIGHPIVSEFESTVRNLWLEYAEETELLRRLSQLTPSYYGICGQPSLTTYEISPNSYMVLNNLTATFSKPCVLDLKMGQRTYEPDANYGKREKEIAKYECQEQYGFRLSGMRVYDPTHLESINGYRSFEKNFGRSLSTPEEIREAFEIFFSIHSSLVKTGNNIHPTTSIVSNIASNDTADDTNDYIIRKRVLQQVIDSVRLVRSWFLDNDKFQFCSSSLLVVYEGDVNVSQISSVKMIDFCHVRRNRGVGDPGYLFGLETLLDVLTDIRDFDNTFVNV